MRGEFRGRLLPVRLVGLVVGSVLAAVIALGAFSLLAIDRAVEPALEKSTRLVGSVVRDELQQALGHGIPLNAIVGLERHLEETLQQFDQVDRIAVHDLSGTPLAQAGNEQGRLLPGLGTGEAFVLPVFSGGGRVADIVVDTSPGFIRTRLQEVFLDVLVVALVAIVVALEVVQAVMASTFVKPLDRTLYLLREQCEGRFLHRVKPVGISGLARLARRFSDHAVDLSQRLAALPAGRGARFGRRERVWIASGYPAPLRLSDVTDMRLALFLFSAATEVATAFLPLYAQAAERPSWLPSEWAASMPLVVYLLGLALLSPLAGGLARRFGPRRLFLAAILPTAAALIGMGASDSVVGITLGRLLLAVCYALATIACQEYALRAAPRRAWGGAAGTSVAVIFGGVFCGSALGGLLAERFGVGAAFATGAAIVMLAGVAGQLAMRGRAGDADGAQPSADPARSPGTPRLGSWSPRLFVLLLGITAPMHATVAIVVWYLTPLLLAEQGAGTATVARVVMLYYLAAVILGPGVTRLSDSRIGARGLVVAGVLLAGLAVLALSRWQGAGAAALAMAGLGTAHTLLRSPLYTLVLGSSLGAPSVLPLLRMIERLAAMLGLLSSVALLSVFGIDATLRLVAAAVLVGGALYTLHEALDTGPAWARREEE